MSGQDTDGQLKVGELAAKTQKTVRALRLYEERGLLTPTARSEGGFRLYDERLADRVSLIDRLQAVGMSLSEISNLLEVWQGAETRQFGMQTLRAEYTRRLLEVRSQIETLRQVEHLLEEGIGFIEGCDTCLDEKMGCGCSGCDRIESAESDLLMVKGVTAGQA